MFDVHYLLYGQPWLGAGSLAWRSDQPFVEVAPAFQGLLVQKPDGKPLGMTETPRAAGLLAHKELRLMVPPQAWDTDWATRVASLVPAVSSALRVDRTLPQSVPCLPKPVHVYAKGACLIPPIGPDGALGSVNRAVLL